MTLADGIVDAVSACRLDRRLLAAVLTVNSETSAFDEMWPEARRLLLRRATADGLEATWLLTIGDSPSLEGFDPTMVQPSQFARVCGEGLDSAERHRVANFLAEAPSTHGIDYSATLCERLLAIRDVLRPSLPVARVASGVMSSMRLEQVIRLSDRAFWLLGWIRDPQPSAARFTAVSPEGARATPREGAVSFHRREGLGRLFGDNLATPTVGFSVYVELDFPSHHPTGWLLELRSATGNAYQDVARQPASTDLALTRRLLRERQPDQPDPDTFAGQVLPIASRLVERSDGGNIDEIRDYGDVPPSPDISIVIATPATDRIEHQLLEFALDREIDAVEIIYAVPHDPDGGGLDALADGLCSLHRVPFRIVRCSSAASRARTLNLGASVAAGQFLVLMSGDVLPTEPGWIGEMRSFLEANPAVGAIGPLLIHEDGSVAHAGATYVRERSSGGWKRVLSMRGLSPSLADAAETRRVAAVSDSCMMVSAQHFRDVGGLYELYLEDGDEAGDLCLGLASAGFETWYLSGARLHLLERDTWRTVSTDAIAAYNAWLIEARWGKLLVAAEGEPSQSPPTGRPVPPPPVLEPGAARPESPVKVLEIVNAPLNGTALLDAGLDQPNAVSPRSPYEDTYSLVVEGWALARNGRSLTIQLRGTPGGPITTVTGLPRPDIGARYPDRASADVSGFQFVVTTLGLPLEFELELVALADEGEQLPLGRVRGRRRPLQSGYTPVLQPLIINTLGRTGSIWLLTLLSRHPEVIAATPFEYEGSLTSYWMEILCTLSEPRSYIEAIQPQREGEHWWIGGGRQGPLPLRANDVDVPRWLGRENVEIIAGFSQSQFDRFYEQVARFQERTKARYFLEKTTPGTTPRLIGELYPDGREVMLVRDLRDRVCSILGYNAKRGLQLWNRGAAETDEEWFGHLRTEANELLRDWRERQQQAHLVRYEDLISDPVATLAGAFSYLGLTARSGTIKRIIEQASQTGAAAQAFHMTSASGEASVGRWRQELSPAQKEACAAAFDDILVEFGYEPTDVTASSPSTVEARG